MKKQIPETQNCLTVEQVAAHLGISRSLAYQLVHEKGFPRIKIHNRFIIPRDRFLEWMEKRIETDST